MDEKKMLLTLEREGLDIDSTRWDTVLDLLAALDAIGRDGANALVKIDGGRTDQSVYTVVISGGPLKEEFFRKDGPELRPLLLEAIDFYVNHSTGRVDHQQ